MDKIVQGQGIDFTITFDEFSNFSSDHILDALATLQARKYKASDVKVYWNGMPIEALAPDSFITIRRGNMKQHTYKLTILYDNGKEYKVNGVTAHYIDNDLPGNVRTLVYNHYNKATKASIRTQIPARDIAALTVKKPDQIIVTKLKPCARISGKAEKK